MQTIRPAAVAGMFYPEAPGALSGAVRDYLARALPRAADKSAVPKALIVPHAGYVYSGPIAASAYARIATGRTSIRRVILLGPVHRVPIRGLALPVARAFATPLGTVEIDETAAADAFSLPQVRRSEAAHALEHALEVQLPFLQSILDQFRIVPFAVGDATAAEVAAVIERLWGGDGNLDRRELGPVALSLVRRGARHRPRHGRRDPRADLSARPRAGLRGHADQRLIALRAEARPCRRAARPAQFRRHGRRQIARGRLCRVRVHRATGRRRASRRGSRRGAGMSRDEQLGLALISIARGAIGAKLGIANNESAAHTALGAPGATFVTLFCGGELRGCIGSLHARRSLRDDVRENAVNAAFHDPRFAPLANAEFGTTSIEVSLLSASTMFRFASEGELLARLRPGRRRRHAGAWRPPRNVPAAGVGDAPRPARISGRAQAQGGPGCGFLERAAERRALRSDQVEGERFSPAQVLL